MNNFLDKIKELLTNEKVIKGKAFVLKYKNYIGVCALFIVMLLVLYFFTGEQAIANRLARINNKTVSGEDYVPDKEFEVDAYSELNGLIRDYFKAYVDADFAILESLATPISDMEKSYISVMSQYYESFENIVCYTKHGLSKNSYIVSACFDIKFHEQEVTAPSMVLFYVQTNVDGKLYINNLYSDFNMKYSEKPISNDVYTALRKYTMQSDYLELYHDVDNEFTDLIKENNDIYQLTKRTIPAVRQEWEDMVFYAPSTEETQGTESTEGVEDTEGVTNTEVSQEPETEQEPESEEPAKPKVITTYGVNIRAGSSADTEVISAADEGEVFVKLGEEYGWTKIQMDDGTIGYIKSNYVEDITE